MPWKVKHDLGGKRFGRLTVLSQGGRTGSGKVLWRYRCDCGTEGTAQSYHLRSGHTQSCGCLMREAVGKINFRHGESPARGPSVEYRCLAGMRERCLNPDNPAYSDYGGRRITIADRWLTGDGEKTGLECFIEDMGRRPSSDHSINRIDNDGNYEPGNCRWDNRKAQANNRRWPRARPRADRRLKTKITADQAAEIKRKRTIEGMRLQEIADEFGISIPLVCDIAKGRRWAHVEARP